MNKKTLIFITFLLMVLFSNAQSWEWVRTGDSEHTEYSDNICVDNSGNVFVVGQSETEVSFGAITLTSTKARFGYLTKYSPNGDALWAIKIIDSDDAYYELMSLTTDQNGNVAVVGYFAGTQTILGEEITSNSGWRNSFIVKLNAAGEKQWISIGTGDLDVNAFDVVSDNDGNFYIVADFIREATFGTITVSANDLNLNNQILIVKYLADGSVAWVTQAGGLSFDNPTGIAYDGTKIFITGYFSSVNAVFGSFIVDSEEVTSIFLAQLEPTSGDFDWVKVIESGLTVTSLNKEENCHIDVNNNAVYLTGYYRDHAAFDAYTSLDNEGEHGFLASFTKTGEVNWVHEVVSDSPGMPYSLSALEDKIYIEGDYITSVTINENELVGTPPGGYFPYLTNAFLYSFSNAGEVNWAKSIDAYYASSFDAGSATVNGVAASGNYVYTSGHFTKTIEFPPFEITSNNSVDVFLAKINTLANSVESLNADFKINIYPIPCSDIINVEFDSQLIQKITLMDLSGRELVTLLNESSGKALIDLSSFKVGIYMLTISSDKENRSTLIIKN